jgi:FlaA1/EpsC-like NDP-sugar epimerase
MLEEFPSEVVKTNVMGTKIVVEAAADAGVRKFVMVSSDKAVNPTNLMGASKRIAEMIVQEKSDHTPMKCITTRFGNVLGSNGSVVPTFKKQIEEGGPIRVTHPDITRYFMTIPEASALVIEAASMGNSNEIFVFDMGEPVRIVDLATKMIRLANLIPEKDIKIEFSGLRPGEKLHEELFSDHEKLMQTHHPKIMKAKNGLGIKIKSQLLDLLINEAEQGRNKYVKSLITELVPELTERQENAVIINKG